MSKSSPQAVTLSLEVVSLPVSEPDRSRGGGGADPAQRKE